MALKLSPAAIAALKKRYLRKDEKGNVIETPEEMLRRVAKAVAEAEEEGKEEWAEKFYQLMESLDFLPNSPALMNAGTPLGQLSACFVIPVEDDMASIFEAVKATALIHQSGGGCVAGGSYVYTTFCGIEPIETLYERVRALGYQEKEEGDSAVIEISDLNIFTPALDPSTGRFAWKKITHIWRWMVPPEQQVTVKASEGIEITTSTWHPFFVFNGTSLEKRRADELQPGDIILTPNASIWEDWPFKEYQEVDGLRLDEDLAWLMGFFLGDGSLNVFRNRKAHYTALRMRLFDGRRETLDHAAKILAKHGVQVTVQKDKRGLWQLTTAKQAFVRPFARLTQVEPGPKTDLTLPEAISKSPLSVIAAFLAGLVDSDGYVSLTRRRVTVTTVSSRLAHQLLALTSALGFEPALQVKAPHGRGKSVTYNVKLACSKKAHLLADWLLPYIQDTFKRERLEALRKPSAHYNRSRMPIPFEAVEDILQTLGIDTHNTAIHKSPIEINGQKFWLHRWRWGKGIGHGTLKRLIPALKEAAPAYRERLELLERVVDGYAVVKEVARPESPATFYDFTVEGYNNYLAGQGKLAVVHNTGFSFSRLRPKGDVVRSTGGIASGPVSFMRVFDTATDVIKQGGRRRGANMGILRVDHPDILEFISCKEREGAFANFNISVAITERFMQALREDGEYELVNPRNGEVVKRLKAREVFAKIVEGAWRNGEPGVIFLDRINEFNPTPHLGKIESTNPCGEQPLLPYESCNLGSINLSNMVTDDGQIDWEKLERTVKLAVRFLDDVITVNKLPLPQIEEATLRTRKIGLGVMGFADMLIKLGIPYDSEEAISIASRIMEAIAYWSKEASVELAKERGPFPAFEGSIYPQGKLPFPAPNSSSFDWAGLVERIKKYGIRNAATTTIAPTGSISIIAGCSSGIEPLFALAFTRKHILDEDSFPEINPLFEKVARERGFYNLKIMRKVAETGRIQDMEEIPPDVRRIFVTALDIAPEWHVRMQAAFQRWTDNSISKTINLPFEATVEDVERAILLAYELGCKGVTVYRDRSRETQVLNVGVEEKVEEAKAAQPGLPGVLAPRPRPLITRGTTEKIPLGCGRNLYVTVNEDQVGLCEVFLQVGKSGGCVASQSEAIGRLISLALRSGINPQAIIKQLKGIRCPAPTWHNGGPILSCADAIAKAMERYMKAQKGEETTAPAAVQSSRSTSTVDFGFSPECPECGSLLEFSEGCVICRNCGYSQCG